MLGLTMQLGLATPLAFMAPHSAPPPPTPMAGVAPVSPVQATPGPEVTPHSPTPAPVPVATPPRVTTGSAATTAPTTTSTTVYSGLECVVTVTGSDGTTMTYSPGPAVEGQCSQGVPEPVTSTW